MRQPPPARARAGPLTLPHAAAGTFSAAPLPAPRLSSSRRHLPRQSAEGAALHALLMIREGFDSRVALRRSDSTLELEVFGLEVAKLFDELLRVRQRYVLAMKRQSTSREVYGEARGIMASTRIPVIGSSGRWITGTCSTRRRGAPCRC